MAKFNKRLFGQEVSPEIIEEIKKLAGGGGFETIETNPIPGLSGIEGDILKSVNPSFEKYLGERTPFSRMWCAVTVKEIDKEGKVDDKTSKIKVFRVNEIKADKKAKINPLESSQKKDTGKIQSVSQLQTNRFSKPEAGITSVTSKTQGSLGAIQNTTVEFVVHNKHDFETIFLPFFLKPGSIVCVDYGWSDQSIELYDPLSMLENEDTEMSKFDSDIYGDGGFLEKNYGKVNTTMGNVVSYDANITPEGSYNCSLEIVSRNAGLLDKEISDDNNLRVLFTNAFDAILVQYVAKSEGLTIERSDLEIEESAAANEKIDKEDVKNLYRRTTDEYLKNSGLTYTAGHVIGEKASRIGVHYSKYTTNNVSTENNNNPDNNSYISLGVFEDFFLNSFVTGLVRVSTVDGAPSTSDMTDKKEYEYQYGSHNSYIRWDSSLLELEKIYIEKDTKTPAFLIPNNWYNSYHANKTVPDKDNFPSADSKDLEIQISEIQKLIKSRIDREKIEKEGKFVSYKGVSVMPMRDLFISVATIVEAFKTKPTINDALLHICNRINQDSHNTFNIKLSTNNESKTKISFVDANLLPPQPKEKRLVFDVMGETSIVSNCDLKFVTPKAGLSSIIAISNLTEPTSFSQVELSQLNNLNLLNKPDGNKNYFIRSLPYKGDINPNIFNDVIGFDMNEIDHKVKTSPVIFDNKIEATENIIRFFEEKSDPDKSGFFDYVGKGVNYVNNKTPLALRALISGIPGIGLGVSLKSNAKPQEAKTVEEITPDEDQIMVNNSKDFILTEIRNKLYNDSGEANISPILPIELDLSIYGNKFLQIGDCYTISYLPEHYKDRTFFQIVGTEDKVDVNGWTTSYTSVLRVDTSTGKFMNSEGEKEVVLDPKSEEFKDKFNKDQNPLDDVKNQTVKEIGKEIIKTLFEVQPDVVTKEQIKTNIRTTYDQRKNGGDKEREILTSAGDTGILEADKKEYTYNWFKGSNGEEVRKQTRGVYEYYESFVESVITEGDGEVITDGPAMIGPFDNDGNLITPKVTPKVIQKVVERYQHKRTGYKLPGDKKGIKINGVYKFIKIKDQKITGAALRQTDPSLYPNGLNRGVGKEHPAYGKFEKAAKDAQVSSELIFKSQAAYFLPATVEEIKKHPEIMYHDYVIDVKKLGLVKNLAMMYAIRNALFKNIDFEGFKVINAKDFPTSPTPLDKLPHAKVEYTDLYDMLRLYHLHKNDKNKQSRSLDEAEVALAKVLQDFGKDNNNLEIEELKSIDVETRDLGIKVPSPIGMIQFRDDNKEAELKKDGSGTRLNTGSKVISLNVHPGAEEFSSADFPKNTLINTKIIIPAYLLENSKKDIQMIANDINRLFASYEKAINDALKPLQIYGDSSFGPD